MAVIPTRIVPSARPAALDARQVGREFRALLAAGATMHPAGDARTRPTDLLRGGYAPRFKVELFDTRFYLSAPHQNPDLRFFVAYVVQGSPGRHRPRIHPRIFYKDVSLIWRAASHLVWTDDEIWVGKGDVRTVAVDGDELVVTAEETTDLPLEIQDALETLNRRATRVRSDRRALRLVLRRAPAHRIVPYADFTAPRRRAAADRRNLVNGGRPIARFRRHGDPASLVFVRGFEPDLRGGIIEETRSSSRLYGGRIRRVRIVSTNRRVQYLFMAAPRHVWIIPAQATTTELSTFGVRTVDVLADEDLYVPGYEYHYLEEGDPPVMVSQIPPGYVGRPSRHDDSRADASAWLERLPIIRSFRRSVLGTRRGRRLVTPAAGCG